jgi:hypothetical protein
LERRTDRLESLEPAVMRKEIADVKDDVSQIARDIAGLRRVLMGFLVTFAMTAVTSAVAILFLTVGHP